MSRRQQPNQRVINCAATLKTIAPDITEALANCSEELSCLGFPSSSGDGKVSGGDIRDGTSNDAQRATELTAWREDMRDTITKIQDATRHLQQLTRTMLPLRERAAGTVARCSDGWMGRDGWDPESGSPEWAMGEEQCLDLPDAHGLCNKHYQRERRWRDKTGRHFRGVGPQMVDNEVSSV